MSCAHASAIIKHFLRLGIERRKVADDAALHWAITIFSLETMNIGAQMTAGAVC